MRKISFKNDYVEFLNIVDNEVIESIAFPLSELYFRFTNGNNFSFYLKSNDQPFKKVVWFDTLPLIIDDETYDDYESAAEALSVAFGEPSKELKEKVEEIEGNLNTALTNIEDNTERIEDLSEEVVSLNEEMEQKADLSEVYTQEQTDLRLNLKVDTSTLENQYYNKDAVDELLSTKANTEDVYSKTESDELLSAKADANNVYSKSEVDIKLDEKADKLVSYTKDEINDLLDEKANYETIQGIEGSINNIYDSLSNHQSQLDGKANANDVYTKSETNDLLNQKANVADLSLKADKTQLEDLNNNISQVEQEVDILTETIANDVYTKSQTDYLLGNKQETLISQQNIKSVQNQDILGEGNIELFSMMNQDEYDSLEEKDSNKLYLITDTHRVYYQDNLIIDGSATPTPPTPTGETETMVTFYYIDGTDGDYIEYTQLKGVAPYTITRQAVMDCLDEAIAKEGIARMVTKIELSDGVHRIDNEAFSGFTSLREVQYGANLREMGSSAFTHCTSLRNLVIPDSVTGETDFTFTECSNATTCYVGTGITTLGGDTFCDCPKLTSCHIPSNVTNLGGEHGGVFARCYALTSVTIDGQINHIGSNTFLETNSLTELWLTGCTNVPSVESDTFVLSDPANVTVHIPCYMRDDYEMSEDWDIFADHYVEEGCGEPEPEPTEGKLIMTLYKNAPDAEDSVAYEVYQNDGETIKQALYRFLTDRFDDDTSIKNFKSSITHVVFDNSVTEISDEYLLSYGIESDLYDAHWRNIESVTLPNNLQTIGKLTFGDMPKVERWEIPSTVTSIGNAAFFRDSTRTNVYRTIRFNSIQPPTLGNNVFALSTRNEGDSADTNQRIEAPTDCEFGNEYYDYFLEKGGTYEEYLNNGVFVADECDEPAEGKLVMTLYTKAPDAEGTVPYEVYQNDGETIKQALYRFLTERFDGDTYINNFKDSITHVVFDNSVTEISGECMFSYSRQSNLHDAHWRNVESVTLPNNLITIGSFTFEDMPKVSYWNIPSTVQRVSSLAFLRVNTNPNVFREIRFNTYGCDPPTFELYNRWSVFDIENEETIDADTNQKITCERNEECREEFSEYFNNLGGNYAEYVTNGVLQPDECH